ncbi:DUF4223 family protein, partial [Salmonella enterica subsp. enterica serovar Kentucky]|nr:DUF4223 family protein [Salmonella enterica subsp. enterica serovar Kentucky]
MNIIGNLYVSNGMSAGNTRNEARVQGLSEVFERYVKNRIIAEIKIAVVAGVLATLTACTGHIENKKNNCSYDYLLHPAISISKI